MRGDPAARIGEDLPEGAERVYHVYDFDGTAYDGDVGALAAGHPESERLGFRSRREFDARVRELRAGGEVPHGGEFAAILERHASADLRTVARVVNESQNPGRLRAGFEAAVPAFGDDLRVVTAGPVAAPGADVDLGADYVLAAAGHDVGVVGSEIENDPRGGVRVRLYCGRDQKPDRVEDALGITLGDLPMAAVGDTAGDERLLAAADQSWALGREAVEAASFDATADGGHRGAVVSEAIADALYRADDLERGAERARERAEGILATRDDWELPALRPTRNADAVTAAIAELYEGLRRDRE